MLRRFFFVRVGAVFVTAALVGASPTAASLSGGAAQGQSAHCSRMDLIAVPGAQVQKTACLDDLTTADTVDSGHTDPDDGAGLHVV